MRTAATWLLKAVTCIVPVFIAACYGMPMPYRPGGQCGGKVVDRNTRAAIPGIQVTCLSVDGYTLDLTWTGADGSFLFEGYACQTFAFEDVDGAQNGTYAARSVTDVGCDQTIELDPA